MCYLEFSAPRKARNLKASPNLSVTTSLKLDRARVHISPPIAVMLPLIMRGLWVCGS